MNANATQKDVWLMDIRLSYFYGFDPYEGTNEAGQITKTYCTHAIMESTHPDLEKVRQAQREVARAGWGEEMVASVDANGNAVQLPKWQAIMQKLAQQDRLCLHNGNISKAGEEAYAGKFFVSANSKVRPTIVATRGGQNVQVQKGDTDAPYSGSRANVLVSVYCQGPNGKPSKFGQRINAQLMGVQFLRHDTAFGGGRVAKMEEFGIVASEADGAAPRAAAAGVSDLF
jgi:hypothetical protein